ncbi:MAG: cell division protein ZipA [Bermanella sp.]
MDISLHSFIFVVGLVVISFIVWDGIKRVREARANRLDESPVFDADDAEPLAYVSPAPSYDELEIAGDLLQGSFVDEEADDLLLAPEGEVPFTGIHANPEDKISANVSQPEAPLEKITPVILQEPEYNNDAFTYDKPQQSNEKLSQIEVNTTLMNDQEAVPVLMEPVELGGQVQANPPKQHELVLPDYIQQTLQEKPVSDPEAEIDPLFANSSDILQGIQLPTEPVGELLSQRDSAQEIIVINVQKESAPLLNGADLYNVFKACDLRHGEMSAFHRFEKAGAQGKIQFSVVNTLKPGVFDLNNMDNLQTPGISLFMSLPGPENPMEAFEAMSEMAQVFARNFNASLYDDSHSDLTPQTLQHYRHRIREYARKYIPVTS